MKYEVLQGDCREVMATLDADSIDAIVSDPPYGLSFMGKGWDHSVPGVEFWEGALRVAKPGAHLLAFGGTRLFHRLAVAIEDAGWEIRDTLMWVYGSGFPKSANVSKLIDKANGCTGGRGPMKRGGERLARLENGKRDGEGKWGNESGRDPYTYVPEHPLAQKYAGWGTALKPAWEPIIMARKPLIGTVAANFEKHGVGGLNIDGCRIRALTGQRPSDIIRVWEQEKNLCVSCAGLAAKRAKPRTPETKGIFAEGRVEPTLNGRAETGRDDTGKVGTGCSAGPSPEGQANGQTGDFSSSIDGSGKKQKARSQTVTKSTTSTATASTIELKTCNACGSSITDLATNASTRATKNGTPNTPAARESAAPAGRWPSNLIHDGSEEVVAGFPNVKAGVAVRRNVGVSPRGMYSPGGKNSDPKSDMTYGDSGSAARFFYCAKASKADRGEGNSHPTVKPTDLMAYLCRLVTPKGGLILDPFCGSGSTGKAAVREGFNFTGIELDPEYAAIARARIEVEVVRCNE
jgi:DNA modification methylase